MPTQRKYPDELRERAVKMVPEIRQRAGKVMLSCPGVGRQRGVHAETLRRWVKQTAWTRPRSRTGSTSSGLCPGRGRSATRATSVWPTWDGILIRRRTTLRSC